MTKNDEIIKAIFQLTDILYGKHIKYITIDFESSLLLHEDCPELLSCGSWYSGEGKVYFLRSALLFKSTIKLPTETEKRIWCRGDFIND